MWVGFFDKSNQKQSKMNKNYYMSGKRETRHLKQNDPNGNIYKRQCANRAKIRAAKRKTRALKILIIVSSSAVVLAAIITLSIS